MVDYGCKDIWYLAPEEWNRLLLTCIVKILSTFNFRPHAWSKKLSVFDFISSGPFSMLKMKTTKSLALCGLIVGNENLVYYIWYFSLSPSI
jgi:hypothetical protein